MRPRINAIVKNTFLFTIIIFLSLGCSGQNSRDNIKEIKVGGPCEGCEAIYEYGNTSLNNSVTLPGYEDHLPQLHINGIIYHPDGKPASNIIVYMYHTDRTGIYPTKGDEKGWARRHGYIRGWIKTDESGKYHVRTFRPASYPSRTEPEHIHMTIKESGLSSYYIDDIIFNDDPLLTSPRRKLLKNRGGSGLVTPIDSNGIWIVNRDIHLGKNIPDYPK